jgi:hypothetical protein
MADKYVDKAGLTYFWGKIKTLLAAKADTSSLKTVATSGSYNDLTNRPTIPSVDASLSSSSTNAIQNKAVYSALSGKLSTSGTAASASKLVNSITINGTAFDGSQAISITTENTVYSAISNDTIDGCF